MFIDTYDRSAYCSHAISFIPAAQNKTRFCIIHPAGHIEKDQQSNYNSADQSEKAQSPEWCRDWPSRPSLTWLWAGLGFSERSPAGRWPFETRAESARSSSPEHPLHTDTGSPRNNPTTHNPHYLIPIFLKEKRYGQTYLCVRVSIEFIEKVHEQVDFQRAHTQHHMPLCLSPMSAVVSSGLLSFHPQINQFLKLHTQKN